MEKKLPTNWTLYIGQGCPYCARVTNFLADQGASIATIDVWKDKESGEKLFEWTGRRTVPYLRMADTGMHESADIVARLAQELGVTSE